jgi:aspartyl/asparaginyl beta-hydroxylase (cupin superfamily)
MQAIRRLPQAEVDLRSPTAMFSVLQPKTRIPPHTGIANFRLVVHLPLVLPSGCGFRVGGETREWRIGEAWVFDDTIEHAAWNDSDETRIILICDIWSPRLSPDERAAIRTVIAATDAFKGTVPGAHI